VRAFIRNEIFERFDTSYGVVLGLAQAALVAWALAISGIPLHLAALGALGLGLALLNARLARPVFAARSRTDWAGRAARAGLLLGFASLVAGTAVAAFTVGLGMLSALLAVAGVAREFGFAVYRGGSLALVGSVGVALAWGAAVGGRHLHVSRQRLPVAGLPAPLAGLRIAHLSDLHIGNGLEDAAIARLVDRVNSLEPDLVALTGDLFDGDPHFVAAGARELGRLRGRLGVFAVLGNHDVFAGLEWVAAALRAGAPQLTLLRGTWVRVPAAAELWIAGLDDPGQDWTRHGAALPALDALAAARPDRAPAVLLIHRPDAFPQAERLGFELVLAGHFHGGQVALPIGGGRWNPARLLSRFHRGLHRLGRSTLFVSRGIGFAGPRIRLGSAPEIALLELEPAGPTASPGAPIRPLPPA
jgi:uncharacterized protein